MCDKALELSEKELDFASKSYSHGTKRERALMAVSARTAEARITSLTGWNPNSTKSRKSIVSNITPKETLYLINASNEKDAQEQDSDSNSEKSSDSESSPAVFASLRLNDEVTLKQPIEKSHIRQSKVYERRCVASICSLIQLIVDIESRDATPIVGIRDGVIQPTRFVFI